MISVWSPWSGIWLWEAAKNHKNHGTAGIANMMQECQQFKHDVCNEDFISICRYMFTFKIICYNLHTPTETCVSMSNSHKSMTYAKRWKYSKTCQKWKPVFTITFLCSWQREKYHVKLLLRARYSLTHNWKGKMPLLSITNIYAD